VPSPRFDQAAAPIGDIRTARQQIAQNGPDQVAVLDPIDAMLAPEMTGLSAGCAGQRDIHAMANTTHVT